MSELERIVEKAVIADENLYGIARHAALAAIKRCVEEVEDSTCSDRWCAHVSCRVRRISVESFLTLFPEVRDDA